MKRNERQHAPSILLDVYFFSSAFVISSSSGSPASGMIDFILSIFIHELFALLPSYVLPMSILQYRYVPCLIVFLHSICSVRSGWSSPAGSLDDVSAVEAAREMLDVNAHGLVVSWIDGIGLQDYGTGEPLGHLLFSVMLCSPAAPKQPHGDLGFFDISDFSNLGLLKHNISAFV
jgi:hypothetical protein